MKLLTVVGSRPQFVKMAPVSRQVKEFGINEITVHTGQHYDHAMSELLFNELQLDKPGYNLGIRSSSHAEMTAKSMIGIEEIILRERPNAVMVYGDTNATLAGSLAAAKLNVPLVHIEAGLRSYDMQMPEEVNRRVVDHISTVLFAPTPQAEQTLYDERVLGEVSNSGDVMYDCYEMFLPKLKEIEEKTLESLGLENGEFNLATVHRPSNTDTKESLQKVMDYIESFAANVTTVLPTHPRTRSMMQKFRLDSAKIKLIDPVGFLQMGVLLRNCNTVLTDSGGVQKEAYFHRKPCVTLRDTTEWMETISHGWNRLWTVSEYEERSPITDYGDGNAALLISKRLLKMA